MSLDALGANAYAPGPGAKDENTRHVRRMASGPLPRIQVVNHPNNIAPADAAAATQAIVDATAARSARFPTRLEHDLLGDRDVPAAAYYGVHTLRAVENFPITGTLDRDLPGPDRRAGLRSSRPPPSANRELGLLDAQRCRCHRRRLPRKIRDGRLHDQFVVDVIQGGAGTSTNMNANEVIANRALELLGHARGDYHHLHPNEHVNLGQSTNDVYPTALKLAAYFGIVRLLDAMARAAPVLRAQGRRVRRRPEDGPHPAAGRRADDAGPGVRHLRRHARRGRAAAARGRGPGPRDQPRRAPRSAPASTPTPTMPARVREQLARHHRHRADHRAQPGRGDAGLRRLRAALRRAQARRGEAVEDLQRPAAAVLRAARRASARSTCRPMQAGSSIMPGKVNPVIPEVVNQIAFEVIGNDITITLRGRGRPAAAQRLRADHRAQPVQEREPPAQRLPDAGRALRRRHHRQPRAPALRWWRTRSASSPRSTPTSATRNATEVAQHAHATGGSVYRIVLDRGLLTQPQLDHLLRPEALTTPQPLGLTSL